MGNWRNVLGRLGRQAVINGILGSPEALGLVVSDIYQNLLGRAADQTSVNSVLTALHNGATLEQVITGIVTSDEFQNVRIPQLGLTGTSQEQLVQALYQTLLQRTATNGEVTSGVNSINRSGVQAVVAGVVNSQEFRTLYLTDLYRTLLNREPDTPGLMGWVHSPLSLLQLRFAFEVSDEFFNS